MNRSAPTARPAAAPRVRWLALIGCVVLVIVAASVCAFLLQYSTRMEGEEAAQIAAATSPVGILLVAVVMTFVWSVIGRFWWSIGLVTGFALLLAVINRNKMELRREPVFPSDFDFLSESGFLLTMVDDNTVVSAILAVVVLVAAIMAIGWLAGRWFPRPRLRRPGGGLHRRFLGIRVGALVLTGGLLVHATSFNGPPNLWRGLYDAKGSDWATQSQLYNYRVNGFLGGFLYNMPTVPMDQPQGYNAEAMQGITDRYEERAAQINADREGSLEDVNVVFVLSESFTDPSWMEGFELETNPIPATQQIMSESISGQMYAGAFGGGTSTMEFESLTGQPVGLFRPQTTSPYQMFVSDYNTYPSAVGAFSALDHHTVAVHAYNLHMYKRTEVYKTFGFDEVIDDAAMQSQEHLERSPYISDEAAYGEVLHHVDGNDDPLFMNLVTMQNHGPFLDFYDDPIGSDIADPSRAQEIGQYARGLSHTDNATAAFLAELRSRDEETIVVFYGDHHPGVYNQEILDANEPEAQVRTPYFVWSSASNEVQPEAAATPAMFLPMVYEAADAPVPPYIALLDDMRHSAPVLQQDRTLDPQGRPLDRDNLDEQTENTLEDLTLVQYDFSIGQRYALDAMWPQAADGQ